MHFRASAQGSTARAGTSNKGQRTSAVADWRSRPSADLRRHNSGTRSRLGVAGQIQPANDRGDRKPTFGRCGAGRLLTPGTGPSSTTYRTSPAAQMPLPAKAGLSCHDRALPNRCGPPLTWCRQQQCSGCRQELQELQELGSELGSGSELRSSLPHSPKPLDFAHVAPASHRVPRRGPSRHLAW